MAGPPRVWVLVGDRPGDNAQMLALAEALGWPFEQKYLAFNAWRRIPNRLLGASRLSLDRRSSPLAPPWPNLVIGCSRFSAPAALWIRRMSGGAARLVHLQHTGAWSGRFDLIITTPQYRQPQAANILHNVAPLHGVTPQSVAAAGRRWAARVAHLPRPFVAALVGGSSSSYLLDAAGGERLGRALNDVAAATGGSVLVTTSPRTTAAATDAMERAVAAPHLFYRWRPDDADNPYMAFLALADRLVVTGDSASMLAEACATGKPVSLFELPPRSTETLSMSAWRRTVRRARGWVKAHVLRREPRDFAGFHRALAQRGLVTPLGASAGPLRRQPLDDMARAVQRVRALLPAGAAADPLPAAAGSGTER